MSLSIKVSELNVLDTITSNDYIIVNDFETLTTKRSTFNSFSIWANEHIVPTHSLFSESSSLTNTASFSLTSSRSLTGDFCNTASFAISSLTSSFVKLKPGTPATTVNLEGTASWANRALVANSVSTNSIGRGNPNRMAKWITGNYIKTGSIYDDNIQMTFGVNADSHQRGIGYLQNAKYVFLGGDVGITSSAVNGKQSYSLYFDSFGGERGYSFAQLQLSCSDASGGGEFTITTGDDGIEPIVFKINLWDQGVITKEYCRFIPYYNDLHYSRYNFSGSMFVSKDVVLLDTGYGKGRLYGTASNAISSSNAITASYALSLLNAPTTNVPVGAIIDFAGDDLTPLGTEAAKWRICDGSTLPIAGYPLLYSILGNKWRMNDGTNFYLPNLCRRTTVGSGGSSVANSSLVGTTVGSTNGLSTETHTLTSTEGPIHTHNSITLNMGTNRGFLVYPNSGTANTYNVGNAGAGDISAQKESEISIIASNSTGGSSHNNMQPSAVVMKIIRVIP